MRVDIAMGRRRTSVALAARSSRRVVVGVAVAHPTLATTVGSHLPNAIPRSDEAICVGRGGIAENFGVINRINSGQTARDHRPGLAASTVAIRPSRRRSSAEKAQGGGDCKCDESHLSTHGGFFLLPTRHGSDLWSMRRVARDETHSKKQIRQIADSIAAFGFLVPILIDDDGVIIPERSGRS
jgi:hypothetical protein